MLDMLDVIRGTDVARTALAHGMDLTSLGLNLNSAEPLYTSFTSPFAPRDVAQLRGSAAAAEDIQYPPSFNVASVVQPTVAKIPQLSDESLFYVFYTFTGDMLQAYAAAELHKRDWRFHREHGLWFARVPGTEASLKARNYERGSYYYFDVGSWERIRKDNFYLQYDLLDQPPKV